VKKVGVCSNSKSKAQNILYVKCDAKRWFLKDWLVGIYGPFSA
jgi:hypothetical protein